MSARTPAVSTIVGLHPTSEIPHRILVMERDRPTADATAALLERQGFCVELTFDGEGVAERFDADPPDLLLLGAELSGETGLSVCSRVRRTWDGPIVITSDQASTFEERVAFELGADDYLARPLDPQLLALRLRRRIVRCTPKPTAPAPSHAHIDQDLRIDRAARVVLVHGERVELTTEEFELLWYLVQHVGRPATREGYYQTVRGHAYDGQDRTMDSRMSDVRRKLHAAGLPSERIRTIRSAGYQLTPARSMR